MAETMEQWYSILQEVYDKYELQIQNLNSDEPNHKKILNQLLEVQKPYKYYLQFKPTSFTEQDYTKIADKLASDAIEQATIEVHV